MATEKRKKLTLILLGILLFLGVWQMLFFMMPLLPSPWPPFYWAWPVHGQVVDADTGAPLEGVIIPAHWELEGSWAGPISQVAVMETVTDKDGRFAFRWWRPRLRWPLWGILGTRAPSLFFFKSGYEWEVCSNDVFSHSGFDFLELFPTSDCDHATIKLKKFQGTEQEYAKQLQHLNHELEFAFRHNDCSWKKIPRMLVTLDQEDKHLTQKGIRNSLGSIEYREEAFNSSHCNSMQKFLRSYMP